MSRLDLARVEVIPMLEEMGVDNVTLEGREVRFSCPFPGHAHGDQNPSAFMNSQTTQWTCFGCGRRGNAISFVADHEGVSRIVAARWLRQRFQGAIDVPPGKLWSEIQKAMTPRDPFANLPVLPVLGEELVHKYGVKWHEAYAAWSSGQLAEGPIPYIFERGFTPWTLEDWGFGYDRISDRILLPARNESGQLVGFKGRSWDGTVPKYRVIGGPSYGFEPYDVTGVLFGAYRTQVDPGVPLLVVTEGELNCVMLHQQGIVNSVGISGQFLSPTQISLIASMCDRAILVFDDPEKAGWAGNKLVRHVEVGIAPCTDWDPAEGTTDENADRIVQALPFVEHVIRHNVKLV